MMDAEQKSETGSTLMVIGLVIWIMTLPVIFFVPSGIYYGHRMAFLAIVITMAAAGLALILSGYRVRGSSGIE